MLPEAVPLLQQQQAALREHILGGGLDARIVRRGLGRENEGVVEQEMGLHGRIVDRQRDENNVEVAAHKLAHQGLGDRFAQAQRQVWKPRLQDGQRGGQQVWRDRWDGPQFEDTRQHPLLPLGIVHKVLDRCENGPGPASNLYALVGQADPGFAPLHQFQLQLVLEILDLHAERGLAHRAIPCRPTKMPRAGKRLQVAELSERHHRR